MPDSGAPAPVRIKRWVVVISSKGDCREKWARTVYVVVLSAGLDNYWERHDEHIAKGDGGVERECYAQCDMILPINKDDLLRGERHGTLLGDTLRRIQTKAANRIGVEAPSTKSP